MDTNNLKDRIDNLETAANLFNDRISGLTGVIKNLMEVISGQKIEKKDEKAKDNSNSPSNLSDEMKSLIEAKKQESASKNIVNNKDLGQWAKDSQIRLDLIDQTEKE